MLSVQGDEFCGDLNDMCERGDCSVTLPAADAIEWEISRLGLLPREEGTFWDGDDGRIDGNAEAQALDWFSEAHAELLLKACYAWLYDFAPPGMACLDSEAAGGEELWH